MNDLFIVSAPFQLLSAIEAKHFFKTQNSTIIYSKELENSLDFVNWNRKIEFPKSEKKSNFKNSLKFVKELKTEEFRYIFVGDFFSKSRSYLQRILSSNLKSEKVIFLDDGILTTLQNLQNGFNGETHFWKLFRWKIFGYKTSLKDFSLFTVLNIEKESLEIFKNDFSFFKSLAEKDFVEKPENFYFIGSAKFETWKMSEENFENFMKKVFAFAQKHQNIYFVPHRHCSQKSLKIVQKIGFQVLKFSKPIEFEFLERKEKPVNIASATSTALLSLKVIFEPQNVFSFKVPENEVRKDRVEGMQNLYKTFSDFGIDLI
ncbi:hypothetical protein ThvES_00006420 [Thiovulum sp. ES]|nr:hypothetical protein ThvES_00006420 [Thiovulum sp. ES]